MASRQSAGTRTSVPVFQRKRTTGSRALLPAGEVAEACRGGIVRSARNDAVAEAVLSRFALGIDHRKETLQSSMHVLDFRELRLLPQSAAVSDPIPMFAQLVQIRGCGLRIAGKKVLDVCQSGKVDEIFR